MLYYEVNNIHLRVTVNISRSRMSHTILLVQPGIKLDTRTYTDFETISECLEVCSNLIFIYKIHKNIIKLIVR